MANSKKYLIVGMQGSGKTTYAGKIKDEEQIDHIFDGVISIENINSILKETMQKDISIIICSQLKLSEIPKKILKRFTIIQMSHRKATYISKYKECT